MFALGTRKWPGTRTSKRNKILLAAALLLAFIFIWSQVSVISFFFFPPIIVAIAFISLWSARRVPTGTSGLKKEKA